VSLARALLHFLREAASTSLGSWRVSLVAMLTIAVSLLVSGLLLLLTGNAERLLADWRDDARLVVYLAADITAEQQGLLVAKVRGLPGVTAVEPVSASVAAERFRRAFPSLGDLLEGFEREPLPTSLEVTLDPDLPDPGTAAWAQSLRASPGVMLVDDDRDWLRQVGAVVVVVRGAGLALGAILLSAAVLTIASVIRLTLYLHRDEIATLRLVGATEFFIRGPFYAQGALQGLCGALAALAALYALHRALAGAAPPLTALFAAFLRPGELALLAGIGGAAGLLGAMLSVRREGLGEQT
jgi:cell division transport system permease protein